MTSSVAPPARAAAPPVPWRVWSVVLASTSAVVGVMWDISWHRSIGRDTFWTPAHLAIYVGGALAGVSCGWLVLQTSFAGTPDERAASVSFWGFRGALGAWVCIWGAIAMIDRKSTRLNSSHGYISYAVFCLKKKKSGPLLTGTPCYSPPLARR